MGSSQPRRRQCAIACPAGLILEFVFVGGRSRLERDGCSVAGITSAPRAVIVQSRTHAGRPVRHPPIRAERGHRKSPHLSLNGNSPRRFRCGRERTCQRRTRLKRRAELINVSPTYKGLRRCCHAIALTLPRVRGTRAVIRGGPTH